MRLWPAPGLVLASLWIAEDPRFGSAPFLTASGLVLRLRLLPLLRRTIVVESVVVEGPRLRIARAADGRLNVGSLGRSRVAKGRRQVSGGREEGRGRHRASLFHIASLEVRGGRVEYRDQRRSGKPVVLDGVSVRAASPSLEAPVRMEARAALEAGKLRLPELRVRGRMRPREMRFHGTFEAPRGTVGAVAFRHLRGRLQFSPGSLRLERVRARSLGGWVSGDLKLDAGRVGLRLRGQDIDLATVGAASALRPMGRADVKVDASGPEPSSPRFREKLTAEMTLAARQGSLGRLGVGPAVLAALGLAFGRREVAAARAAYPDLLGGEGLRFSRLDAAAHLSGGRVNIRRATLAAPSYTARASGRVDLGGRIDLAVTVRLARGLSQSLVHGRAERAVLLDSEGRVAVPVRVTGNLPQPAVYPEPAFAVRLGERALEEQGLRRPARRLFKHLRSLRRKRRR